jgi:uncharacterized OB-fold protein
MSQFAEPIYRHATYSSLRSWRERHGRYRLVGSRCTACKAASFPRRSACAVCQSRELEPYECARTGTVVVVWEQVGLVRLLGYSDLPPRFIAIVKLDDGTHIETELVDIAGEQAEAGLRVCLVLRKLRRESNGNWLYGFKFAPLSVRGGA